MPGSMPPQQHWQQMPGAVLPPWQMPIFPPMMQQSFPQPPLPTPPPVIQPAPSANATAQTGAKPPGSFEEVYHQELYHLTSR